MSDSTPHDAGTWREAITRLLKQQREHITRLRGLADQQGEHIREGRSDALLSIISQRQDIIDQFLDGHRAMQSLTSRIDEYLDQISRDERETIRSMIDEINAMLSEVIERDDADRQKLDDARQSVRAEMASIHSGQQARNAYLKPGRDSSAQTRFADQQG